MKTNYPGHDELYRERREGGRSGWATPEQHRVSVAELEQCLASSFFPPRGRILELGSGAGEVSVWLAGRGFDVCGVELSPTAVEWARERAAGAGVGVRFEVGDVLALAPDLRDFDVALDGHCFHCIIGPDRARFLAGARTALRPGGLLVVRTMCGPVTSPRLAAVFDEATRCILRDGYAWRYIGRAEDILGEIAAAGFDVRSSAIIPRDPSDADDQDELIAFATTRR